VRLGLPKGRLLPVSNRVLAGLKLERDSPSVYRLAHTDVTVWLLKMCDIPWLVQEGHLDLGLAPDEWVEETGPLCERLATIDGYSTRVSVLAPGKCLPTPKQGERLRVATAFPNVARRYLNTRDDVEILAAHGSAEAYPPELADVVVDCVETGDTARLHGLLEVEQLLDSRLQLIASPAAGERVAPLAEQLVAILDGPQPSARPNGEATVVACSRSVAFHDLPPYLRAPLLPWIHRMSPHRLGDWGIVRVAGGDSESRPYMRVWDRTLEVTYPDEYELTDLQQALERHIATGGLSREATNLFTLIVLLSVWDNTIRDTGLYEGRVYLASEEATRKLFVLAGAEAPSADAFRTLLLEAQALELMYRFPVAYKFRREYGVENQCRLNGWGRRLAQRALKDPTSAQLVDDWEKALRSHLIQHRDTYTTHIDHVASEGLTTAPANSWLLANQLPVPILL
jgi:ATP phosphoribosyltransferase